MDGESNGECALRDTWVWGSPRISAPSTFGRDEGNIGFSLDKRVTVAL